MSGQTGAVTWSKSGADAADFGIVSGTGVLSLQAPNHENPRDANRDNVYEVTATATDEDGVTGLASLAVTVTNVNEAPWYPASALTLAVPEGTVGAFGSPVVATDPEGKALAYSLGGTDAATFRIDACRRLPPPPPEPPPPPAPPPSPTPGSLPAAPADLHVEILDATGLRLAWRDNSVSETGFTVQHRSADDADDGAWTVLANTAANDASAVLSGLEPGLRHAFRVGAVGANGTAFSLPAAVRRRDGCVELPPRIPHLQPPLPLRPERRSAGQAARRLRDQRPPLGLHGTRHPPPAWPSPSGSPRPRANPGPTTTKAAGRLRPAPTRRPSPAR